MCVCVLFWVMEEEEEVGGGDGAVDDGADGVFGPVDDFFLPLLDSSKMRRVRVRVCLVWGGSKT